MNKPFYQSKIFWVNIISVVISIIGIVTPQFPEYAKIIGLIIPILTIILRQLQNTEIQIGGRKFKM